MEKEKVLLKLGGRKHLGEERWRGGLNLFDKIYVTSLYTEMDWEINSDRVIDIKLPYKFLTSKCIGVLKRTNDKKFLNWLSWLAIWIIRLENIDWLKRIKNINPDFVLCSYGDYDRSDLNCLLAKSVVKAPIVRAYKESRPEYNFRELRAIKASDTIVLCDIELKKFLEKKYGQELFKKKKLLIGYDENALPSCILNNIKHREKLSKMDGKVHLVILTFRVDSAPNRERDQGRYYYIDIIKSLLDAGVVVHLHCAQYNDDNGINRYDELEKQYPGSFYKEEPLEMRHDSTTEEWVESCEVLSRYDIGLLHNILDNTSVSEFDRINVPHRFFAYEAAWVTPVIERGSNMVLEKMFAKQNCGYVFDSFKDLSQVLNKKFDYYTPSYEDYLKGIFNL